MTRAYFIGSNIYRGSRYGARHPLSIERVPAVTDLCRALDLFPSDSYRLSPRAKPKALFDFHTRPYVAQLMAAETRGSVPDDVRARHGLGTPSNPVFAEMFRRPATAVGGGLLAADLVARGGAVFNPGGGTHHGMPDRASGFCFLNEPVLTIRRLLQMGLTRIAYVDIDAHHGDGVEAGFAGSRQVRCISVHEEGRWPRTGHLTDDGAGSAFNLPVPRGFNDSEFFYVLEQFVLPAVDSFAPEAIFLQCGADALAEDPLSGLALSNHCHVAALRRLRPMAPRLIVSGGGGYNPWSVARCWTRIWAELSGQHTPPELPDTAQQVLGALTWGRKAQPAPAMLHRLSDTPREGPIRAEIVARVGALLKRL